MGVRIVSTTLFLAGCIGSQHGQEDSADYAGAAEEKVADQHDAVDKAKGYGFAKDLPQPATERQKKFSSQYSGMRFEEDRFGRLPKSGTVVHIDASGRGYCGAVIIRSQEAKRHFRACRGSSVPVAECEALKLALENLQEGESALIVTDSEHTFRQLKCEYDVNLPRLAELHKEISQLEKSKNLQVTLRWVQRQFNKEADKALRKYMNTTEALEALSGK